MLSVLNSEITSEGANTLWNNNSQLWHKRQHGAHSLTLVTALPTGRFHGRVSRWGCVSYFKTQTFAGRCLFNTMRISTNCKGSSGAAARLMLPPRCLLKTLFPHFQPDRHRLAVSCGTFFFYYPDKKSPVGRQWDLSMALIIHLNKMGYLLCGRVKPLFSHSIHWIIYQLHLHKQCLNHCLEP